MMGAVETVGLIGAGRMGTPIISHLVRKGFKVLVHDAAPAKRALAEERGAAWAADCSALSVADALLICVGYDSEVRELTIASTIQKMLLDVVAVGGDVEWLPMSAACSSTHSRRARILRVRCIRLLTHSRISCRNSS